MEVFIILGTVASALMLVAFMISWGPWLCDRCCPNIKCCGVDEEDIEVTEDGSPKPVPLWRRLLPGGAALHQLQQARMRRFEASKGLAPQVGATPLPTRPRHDSADLVTCLCDAYTHRHP